MLTILCRAVGYLVVRPYRVAGHVSRATIIVGCGRVGNKIASTLLEHPEYGLRPAGYGNDDPLVEVAQRRVPLLGGTGSLAPLLIKHNVRNVIFAFTAGSEAAMVNIIHSCYRLAGEMTFVPRLYELHGAGRDRDGVGSAVDPAEPTSLAPQPHVAQQTRLRRRPLGDCSSDAEPHSRALRPGRTTGNGSKCHL